MEETNKVYRIRTKVGTEAPNVIHVPLNQTYDMFEILSLKLNQTNMYKLYESNYGVIVGRVIANGGFGVENAKISIFIPVSDSDRLKDKLLYNFTSVNDRDNDGVRYNLLPDYVDDGCHQNVGTFPNKRLILDNDDVIEMFDKYWKYTTTTNHSGDYMLFGIPVGSQQLHCDIDLSDCGILSQRPRDMMSKGYNANMFESPNKFKKSKDINSLVQIVSEDRGVYVHPYWGDTSNGDEKFAITRCDINLEYKFETSAVFIGSVVTDKGNNAIGKNCTSTDNNGNMSDLITGNGKIEMIRKTVNNKVESFSIMGDRLIDGDGVWCYSIPMNLDYVTTDEFGNLVPTDNPERGIATRARVRFRFTLDENPNDASARKRASYLVPNNPKIDDAGFVQTFTPDYEFGTATREESFCDLLWNKVYTVKNYIPKLQKKADFFHSTSSNRKHSGIKLINHHGDNNPMPYNALTVKLGFTYRLICTITKIIINLIEFINQLLSIIGAIFGLILSIINLPIELFNLLDVSILGAHPLRPVVSALTSVWRVGTYPIVFLLEFLSPSCIGLSSEFCDDGVNPNVYYPGCGRFLFNLFTMNDVSIGGIDIDLTWKKTREDHEKNQLQICKNEGLSPTECEASLTNAVNSTAMLYNCIENQLAQQNETTSFNFYNDWVNGVLYLPLWYRKITPKKTFFFGLFKKSARDEWCSSDRYFSDMRLLQDCALRKNALKDNVSLREDNCGNDCHKSTSEVRGFNGVIVKKETMLGQNIYYYQAAEYDSRIKNEQEGGVNGGIKLMFATDIVLLGALNECDIHGIPQFFKSLDNTTYNMPTDILFTDYDFIMTLDDEGKTIRYEDGISDVVKTSEMAGCDWGNPNEFGEYDGGLFYSIGCTSRSTHLEPKSCVNLSRICEFGVSLDETKDIMNLGEIEENTTDSVLNNDTSGRYVQKLITDGIISWDELYNLDERSMFATMNSNHLKTKLNQKNGLVEYDFDYLYPENFDGLLKDYMRNKMRGYKSVVNYKDNYKLEQFSLDYYRFRMGKKPYFYDIDNTNAFPRYDNSYYFYFGLKAGKTAIEKFNTLYFADCSSIEGEESNIGIIIKGNSWCCPMGGEDGYIAFDFSNISTPYNLSVIRESNDDVKTLNEVREEKIIFCNEGQSVPSELNDYTRKASMLANDAYSGTVTDSNGNIVEFRFKVESKYLEYEANIQNFTMSNDILARDIGVFTDIAKNSEGLDYNNNELVLRKIGGVLTISQIRMPDEYVLDGYKIEIRSDEPLDGYNGVSLRYIRDTIQYYEGGQWKVVSGNSYKSLIWSDKDNHNYAFGLPKADISYTVSIVQLCGDEDSGNIVEKSIDVTGPTPYKMLINDIDYDLIKRFDDREKQSNVNYDYTGWKISGNLKNPNFVGGTFDVPTNPWFHIDNIYYNDKLIVDVISFIGVNNNGERTFTYGSQDSGGRYKWNANDVSVYTLDRNPSVNSKLFTSAATTNNTVWGTIKTINWGRIDGVIYPSNKDISSFIVELSNSDELKGFKIYGINNKNEKIGETTREILYNEFETIPEDTNNVYYDWSGDYIISDFNDVEWDDVLTIFVKKEDKLVGYTFDGQDVSSVNEITVNNNQYVLNRDIHSVEENDKVNHIIVSDSNGDEKKYSFVEKTDDGKYQWVFKETDTTDTPSTTTNITVLSTGRDPDVGDTVKHKISNEETEEWEEWYITEVVKEIMYEWDYTDSESGETKKIYTNTYSPEENKDIAYNSLDDYSVSLSIINISTCAGYYKWDGEENSVWTEKRNPQIGEDIYEEPVLWKKDSYDSIIDRVTEEYDRIESFVDAVNNVLQQRRELITSMYQTFYIASEGESKDIIVRGRTEQLPCTQTFVYHKEKTPEFGELNILDGEKAKAEDSDINNGVVTNIQLPTITYNGSPYAEMFNGKTVQGDTNEPILTNKYPYSVGIMNNIGVSMPKKYNFDTKSNIKYIEHYNTNLIDLFNFPIIEKILSNDAIIWTAFVNIPEYKPNSTSNDAPKKIMMNGLFAGYIYNGNLVGREFPTRTLNNRNLLISDNLISDNRTYIEKRFIEQFEGDNDWEHNYNYPFKNYKVYDAEFAEYAQYAYVEPSSAQFNLRDDASGYLSLSINGNTQFKLTKDSVHDCNDYSKTMIYLEVANAEYYYIYDAGQNGEKYPLVKASSNTVGTGEEAITTWEITDEINGEYDANKPQNMLSYQNRDLTKKVDVQWIGELDISDDYDPLAQPGYGNRGGFKYSQNSTPNPIFAVAETKDNIRTLSPIYDFSDVTARVGLRVTSKEDVTHYYAFIKLSESENNYLKNFDYKLRGTCINSEVSPKVIFNEQEFKGLGGEIEVEITLDQYTELFSILLEGGLFYNRLYESFQIVATDCTGLPHICKVVATLPSERYTFNLNLPDGYTVDNDAYFDNEGQHVNTITIENDGTPPTIHFVDNSDIKKKYRYTWDKNLYEVNAVWNPCITWNLNLPEGHQPGVSTAYMRIDNKQTFRPEYTTGPYKDGDTITQPKVVIINPDYGYEVVYDNFRCWKNKDGEYVSNKFSKPDIYYVEWREKNT